MQPGRVAEVSSPLAPQPGALLKGRLERAHRCRGRSRSSRSLGGANKTLRQGCWHLQGRRCRRLGHEDARVEQGLARDEARREGRVRDRARLPLLEEPARRQQADRPAQLARRDPCQVGQVLGRYAQLGRDACQDLELCKPLEAREDLCLYGANQESMACQPTQDDM